MISPVFCVYREAISYTQTNLNFVPGCIARIYINILICKKKHKTSVGFRGFFCDILMGGGGGVGYENHKFMTALTGEGGIWSGFKKLPH